MNEKTTFDPAFFAELKKAEEKYFWFQIRRKWIFDRIKKFIAPPGKVLEMGCGTGNVSSFLSQKGYLVTGCELYTEAIDMAWPGFRTVREDIKNLSFGNNSFDIAGLFDVIEHFEDDITPLKEAFRVVRQGGIIALTVPAGEELWSWVDEVSLHRRRYSKQRCEQILSEAGFNPLLVEYMFMSLYLPVKYLRRKNKRRNDHFKINRIVNTLLKGIFDVERFISKGVPLPAGTSIIAIAQKP